MSELGDSLAISPLIPEQEVPGLAGGGNDLMGLEDDAHEPEVSKYAEHDAVRGQTKKSNRGSRSNQFTY